MVVVKIEEYLLNKFLEWQLQQGKKRSITQFAEWLDIPQTTLSSYLNGKRKPEGETLEKLARKLGLEVYDVLGLDRPDPDLFFIITHWDEVSIKTKRVMREERERYLSENANREERKRRANT